MNNNSTKTASLRSEAREELIAMHQFDAHLTRKNIKNINIRINTQGQVKVSAPMRCALSTIQHFLQEKQVWILHHQTRLKNRPMYSEKDEEHQSYHHQMEALIPDLLKKWENRINVQVNQWGIKAMKTRWGSCHPIKKHIWLNLYLIHYPLCCTEYVLVHELLHLLEASHNKRFYALMNHFLPEWKIYKTILDHQDEAIHNMLGRQIG